MDTRKYNLSAIIIIVLSECYAFIYFLGVIYLKNLITSNWVERETENAPLQFSIHEQDRAMIRDAIVDAVVHAPDLIR